MKTKLTQIAAGLALAATAMSSQAAFNISLDFSGGGLSAYDQSFFSAAADYWESVITGYKDAPLLSGVTISASGAAIDGVYGVLGSAGPNSLSQGGGSTYWYAVTGSMQFDTADIANMQANGSFTDVIKHEMAHVLGFGTLWNANGLYTDTTGQYTGAYALAAFKVEYNQPSATYVPVELTGGPGTADGHWDETSMAWGSITDVNGRNIDNELMTGWLTSPTHVSQTTKAQFEDLGYNISVSEVPEPPVLVLMAAALPLLLLRRARRVGQGSDVSTAL